MTDIDNWWWLCLQQAQTDATPEPEMTCVCAQLLARKSQ